MDRRDEQLIAAAEAVRTWVHAQRATWTDGYPRVFADAGAQVLSLSAPSLTLAPPAMVDADMPSESSIDSRERTAAPIEQLRAGTLRVASLVTQSGLRIRQNWRTAAMAVVVLAAAWAIPTYWSDMKALLTTNVAAGRRVVASRRQALTELANRDASTSAAPAPTDGKSGTLQVESTPAGATVLVDGRDRGVTPLTIEGLSLGSHKVVLRAAEGLLQRTISIKPGATVQLNEAIFSGWLHVSSPIEIKMSEGSRTINLDDRNQALLAPGPHEVSFENRALGIHVVKHVEVRPGETTSISFEPPVSHLSVTTSEGATVAIDGEPAGDAPLVDYPVKIGTRDLTVTSASGEVRRQTITVTVEPARIEVDFSKR